MLELSRNDAYNTHHYNDAEHLRHLLIHHLLRSLPMLQTYTNFENSITQL